jgi:hypothetical protein
VSVTLSDAMAVPDGMVITPVLVFRKEVRAVPVDVTLHTSVPTVDAVWDGVTVKAAIPVLPDCEEMAATTGALYGTVTSVNVWDPAPPGPVAVSVTFCDAIAVPEGMVITPVPVVR